MGTCWDGTLCWARRWLKPPEGKGDPLCVCVARRVVGVRWGGRGGGLYSWGNQVKIKLHYQREQVAVRNNIYMRERERERTQMALGLDVSIPCSTLWVVVRGEDEEGNSSIDYLHNNEVVLTITNYFDLKLLCNKSTSMPLLDCNSSRMPTSLIEWDEHTHRAGYSTNLCISNRIKRNEEYKPCWCQKEADTHTHTALKLCFGGSRMYMASCLNFSWAAMKHEERLVLWALAVRVPIKRCRSAK